MSEKTRYCIFVLDLLIIQMKKIKITLSIVIGLIITRVLNEFVFTQFFSFDSYEQDIMIDFVSFVIFVVVSYSSFYILNIKKEKNRVIK